MPLFTFKCSKCGKRKEKFLRDADQKPQMECECGEQNFERVFDFAAKGETWRGAADHFENVIKPEVDRFQERVSKGSDSAFLDIAGD